LDRLSILQLVHSIMLAVEPGVLAAVDSLTITTTDNEPIAVAANFQKL
jgi:hypothetical protein